QTKVQQFSIDFGLVKEFIEATEGDRGRTGIEYIGANPTCTWVEYFDNDRWTDWKNGTCAQVSMWVPVRGSTNAAKARGGKAIFGPNVQLFVERATVGGR